MSCRSSWMRNSYNWRQPIEGGSGLRRSPRDLHGARWNEGAPLFGGERSDGGRLPFENQEEPIFVRRIDKHKAHDFVGILGLIEPYVDAAHRGTDHHPVQIM